MCPCVLGNSNLAEIGSVMINNVAVTGNIVTIVINGFEEVDGYDYVFLIKKIMEILIGIMFKNSSEVLPQCRNVTRGEIKICRK